MAFASPTSRNKSSPGCLILFGLVFALAGGGFALIFVFQAFKDYRMFTVYKPATAKIMNKRLIDNRSSKGGHTYRPEFTFTFSLPNEQSVQVTGYDGWDMSSSGRDSKDAVLNSFTTGQSYPCWYDPDNPQQAVLVRHISWMYLLVLFPMLFVAVGLGVMYLGVRQYRTKGASPESEALNVQAGSAPAASKRKEIWQAAFAIIESNGSIPTLVTKPGQSLAVSLPSDQSGEGCGAVFVLIFGTVWTAISTGMFSGNVAQAFSGQFNFITVFMLPFLMIGFGTLGLGLYLLMIALGDGTTALEASSARLAPGQAFELNLSQTGNLNVNKIVVKLLCEEHARSGSGKNSKSVREIVHTETLHEAGPLAISKGRAFSTRFSAKIPASAMHSFKSANNDVTWRLQVTGDIAMWPDFKRDFPIVVAP